MAEESVGLPVTPEVIMSCGVELRRYSTGKASSGDSEENVVPHYRRASTGTCHDFCKYGRKHAFEVKDRYSIAKIVARKPLCRSSGERVGGTKTSVAKLRASVDSKLMKNMPVVKVRESVDAVSQISDTSDTNQKEMPTKSPNSQKQIKNEVPVNRKKTSLIKIKLPVSPKSRTSDLPRTMRQGNSSISAKVETSSKSNAKAVETSSKSTNKVGTSSKSTVKVETSSKSTVKKVETSSKSTIGKGETSSKSTIGKGETSSKSTIGKVETSSKANFEVGASLKPTPFKAKQMELSEKHVTSSKSNPVTVKTIFSMNSPEGSSGHGNSKLKMEERAAFPKVASRKLLTPSRTLLPPKPSVNRVSSINARKNRNFKVVSHLKNQSKTRKDELKKSSNDEVEEKTLYVIRVESKNKTLQSDQNASHNVELSPPQSLSPPKLSSSSCQKDQEESKYTTREVKEDSFSGNLEIEHMKSGKALKMKEKGKPTRGRIVCSEDKGCQMSKLNFKRGKMVDFQSEKNSPRRLKFQRAKVSRDNANVKDENRRKGFKRRDETGIDRIGTTTGPEKVVLRHRDVQGKKDAQVLFNNVIEETASKLAEIRKSKVKALVGAFETVISLQEKKPPANTVS